MLETLVILALIAVTGLAIWRIRAGMKRRSSELRRQFHSEYDREVDARGKHRAEAELQARKRRVADYSIHPLTQAQYERFSNDWRHVQSQFVDNPDTAVILADRLVKDLMAARGYPMNDFETRVRDLSVTHPKVVAHYRKARSIAETAQNGQASTESLRQATVEYRTLVEELLVSTSAAPGTPPSAFEEHRQMG